MCKKLVYLYSCFFWQRAKMCKIVNLCKLAKFRNVRTLICKCVLKCLMCRCGCLNELKYNVSIYQHMNLHCVNCNALISNYCVKGSFRGHTLPDKKLFSILTGYNRNVLWDAAPGRYAWSTLFLLYPGRKLNSFFGSKSILEV